MLKVKCIHKKLKYVKGLINGEHKHVLAINTMNKFVVKDSKPTNNFSDYVSFFYICYYSVQDTLTACVYLLSFK